MTLFSGAPMRIGFDFRGRSFAYTHPVKITGKIAYSAGDKAHRIIRSDISHYWEMAYLYKKDIENIKLLHKETKLGSLSKIRIKKGDYEIELSSELKSNSSSISEISQKINKNNSDEKIVNKEINEENIVKSPMVGVAYLSADPNSQAYVKVGQHVKQGDVLLLIEAMKTFNEIKAPKTGVIKEIRALNSQPVEFGDTLIIFE